MPPISIEYCHLLVRYNYWARDLQLEACARLAPAQFVQPMGNSFSSVRDTLVDCRRRPACVFGGVGR